MPLSPPTSPHEDVLPLDQPEWEWRAFERFCLGLVRTQPDVASASLYGTRGQAQLGIDIAAELIDGCRRTYQCRKWRTYTKPDAESTVADTTYEADEHVILVTCEVGTQVRDYMEGLEGPVAARQGGHFARCARDRATRAARRLVEDTFTVAWRRAFLGPPGPLGFWEADDYFESLLDDRRLFRHTWELVGRNDLLAEISAQLSNGTARVLMLVGRGGIGKTRVLRELADSHKGNRTVLFADDDVPLTAESVDELPWTRPLVIVDDAHRRDDLGPLLTAARRGEEPPTVLLATRPHRIEELRARLSLSGFGPEEVWVSEPMSDLPRADVRSLACQALGEEHAHFAGELATATADCPLVTVVGGQLLARRAIPPELLEREGDFRATVLDRFRDEMLGRLSNRFGEAAARETLVLLAALGPLSVENTTAIRRMAEDVGVQEHEIRSLLSELEDAGVVRLRGRLRRIMPDVLADHILHRSCLDAHGRPTGRADALLVRYSDVALVALLGNLAELDWRIAQTQTDVALLDAFWHELRGEFLAVDADGRLHLIELIRPVAQLAPDPVFDLVCDAIATPTSPARVPLFGHEITDNDVRLALPPLLGSIALTPRMLPDVLTLLWELGRDDKRPLQQNAGHALRIIEDLASYRLPLLYAKAALELAV